MTRITTVEANADDPNSVGYMEPPDLESKKASTWAFAEPNCLSTSSGRCHSTTSKWIKGTAKYHKALC